MAITCCLVGILYPMITHTLVTIHILYSYPQHDPDPHHDPHLDLHSKQDRSMLLQDAANQVENAMTAASDCGHQIVAQYLICML